MRSGVAIREREGRDDVRYTACCHVWLALW
jgi:hypothetical protein